MGFTDNLDYKVNKLISPKKVLLIDDQKVIETLQSIQVAIANLANNSELKKDNPLDNIKNVMSQFIIKSGVHDNKGTVGGYKTADKKGRPFNASQIVENGINYRNTIIKELGTAEHQMGRLHDMVRKNWDILLASSCKLNESNVPSLVDKKIISEIFDDKEKTLDVLRSLHIDIRDNKNEYAKRLGIGTDLVRS